MFVNNISSLYKQVFLAKFFLKSEAGIVPELSTLCIFSLPFLINLLVVMQQKVNLQVGKIVQKVVLAGMLNLSYNNCLNSHMLIS